MPVPSAGRADRWRPATAQRPNLIDELLGDEVERFEAVLRAGQHDSSLTRGNEDRGEPPRIVGPETALPSGRGPAARAGPARSPPCSGSAAGGRRQVRKTRAV